MEENHVQDETSQTPMQKQSYKKFEIALLLVLGILVGFSVKTEAAKRITMGFDDYLISQKDMNAIDINKVQKNMIAQGETASIASPQAGGGLCAQ